MFPFLFTAIPPSHIDLGFFSLSLYGLCTAFGAVAAYAGALLCIRRFGRYGDEAFFDRLALAGLFGGIIGARTLFVAYHPEYFFAHPLEIPAVWQGGWVWHGGLLGGMIAAFVAARSAQERFWRILDCAAPALAFGQAIGRWGNYFNQEAYGAPADVWWAIPIDTFHRLPGYEAFSHFHPAFLYESVGLAAIAIGTYLILRLRLHVPGIVFLAYLAAAAALRFALEFMRIDDVPLLIGIRFPQVMSMVLFVAAFAGMWLLWKKRGSASPRVSCQK